MTLILSGTDGLSDVDGTAGTPAIRGTDTNTGIFFGADIIGFSEGGVEVARFNADAQFVAAAGTALLPVITTTGDVNTGIFFPAADTIAFAEGGTEVGRFDSSANFQFNSGYGSAAVAYGCRAWVNFNGTGTVAIRASGNVSSITDNGTGYYTLNYGTAMPDVNYSYLAKSTRSTNNTAASTDMNNSATCVDPTTSTLIVKTGYPQGVNTVEDSPNVTVAIFR